MAPTLCQVISLLLIKNAGDGSLHGELWHFLVCARPNFLTADQEHTAAHTLTLPLSLELLVTVLNIIRALQRTRDLYKSVQSFSDFVFGPKG